MEGTEREKSGCGAAADGKKGKRAVGRDGWLWRCSSTRGYAVVADDQGREVTTRERGEGAERRPEGGRRAE